MEHGQQENRIKRLELLGGIGAGILGAGLALLFADYLQRFAVPALLLGIVSHGWAMFQKGRMEQQAGILQPRWAEVAEWVCWAMLAALFACVAFGILA